MLDQAFEALNTYDWGTDLAVLAPIDDAVLAAHKDAAASGDLEQRLAAVLASDASRDAKDYVCRKLMLIGTAASTPALAALLPEADHSHMARFALQQFAAPEAAQALRDALPKVSGVLKVGVLSSLGARREAENVAAIAPLLADSDAAVARAAALALGAIRSPEASQALAKAKPADAAVQGAVVDASLACAEALLAANKKAEALAIYKPLATGNQSKQVRLAATRGMLACAGTKQ